MNNSWRAKVEYLDELFYWVSVALVIIGLFTDRLTPPNIDAMTLSGIIFFCMVLKPMILIRSRS